MLATPFNEFLTSLGLSKAASVVQSQKRLLFMRSHILYFGQPMGPVLVRLQLSYIMRMSQPPSGVP